LTIKRTRIKFYRKKKRANKGENHKTKSIEKMILNKKIAIKRWGSNSTNYSR
jgi:hypothetical protein